MNEPDVATEVFKMRLSAALKEKLEAEAKRLKRSTSDLVRGLVEAYLTPGSERGVATEVDAPKVQRMKPITMDGGPVLDENKQPVPSLSLAEAYGSVVLKRSGDQPKPQRLDPATSCVACGGPVGENYTYTNQLKPICQACARERAGT